MDCDLGHFRIIFRRLPWVYIFSICQDVQNPAPVQNSKLSSIWDMTSEEPDKISSLLLSWWRSLIAREDAFWCKKSTEVGNIQIPADVLGQDFSQMCPMILDHLYTILNYIHSVHLGPKDRFQICGCNIENPGNRALACCKEFLVLSLRTLQSSV